MPTKNNIRVELVRNRTNAKVLASQLRPDVDPTSMSYIVQGRVLPTKDTLTAMTAILNCETKDLYDLNDIDLSGFVDDMIQAIKSAPLVLLSAQKPSIKRLGDHGHDGMERVYIWYPSESKEALFEVMKQLDYPSVAEWFRDMARITFEKAAKLNGKPLHEAAKEGSL
jgi:hypothetical protein